MDDVTLRDETERFGTLALEGPSAAAIVKELTGVDLNSLGDLERRDARAPGTIPCTIVRRTPGKFVGGEFLVERSQMEPLWHTLEAKSKAAGGRGPIGYSALSAVRLEQGIPWFSYDFGEKANPSRSRSRNQPHQLHKRLLHRPGNRRACAVARPSESPPRRPAFHR